MTRQQAEAIESDPHTVHCHESLASQFRLLYPHARIVTDVVNPSDWWLIVASTKDTDADE